jgi:hypothetical protein
MDWATFWAIFFTNSSGHPVRKSIQLTDHFKNKLSRQGLRLETFKQEKAFNFFASNVSIDPNLRLC